MKGEPRKPSAGLKTQNPNLRGENYATQAIKYGWELSYGIIDEKKNLMIVKSRYSPTKRPEFPSAPGNRFLTQ